MVTMVEKNTNSGAVDWELREEDQQAQAALECAKRNAPTGPCRRMHMFAAQLFATNAGWSGGSFDVENDDDILRVVCKDHFREWLYKATSFFMREGGKLEWKSPELPAGTEPGGAAAQTGELQAAAEQV